MFLGNLFSMLALACLIVDWLFHPTLSEYMYAAESLLLAAASWFFDVHAAVFVFLISAVSWMLRAKRKYAMREAFILHWLTLLGGLLLNNRG